MVRAARPAGEHGATALITRCHRGAYAVCRETATAGVSNGFCPIRLEARIATPMPRKTARHPRWAMDWSIPVLALPTNTRCFRGACAEGDSSSRRLHETLIETSEAAVAPTTIQCQRAGDHARCAASACPRSKPLKGRHWLITGPITSPTKQAARVGRIPAMSPRRPLAREP